MLDEASRLHAQPAAEVDATQDEEGRRIATAFQRAGALRIVDAWISLARDLLVTNAGRPDLAPSATLELDVAGAADRIDTTRLPVFVGLLERTREGLLQNAAPQLALQVAMLSWPRVESS